jgi:hypothetical protein
VAFVFFLNRLAVSGFYFHDFCVKAAFGGELISRTLVESGTLKT